MNRKPAFNRGALVSLPIFAVIFFVFLNQGELGGGQQWLLYAGLGAFAIAAFVVLFAFAKRRTKRMQQASAGLGLSFAQLGTELDDQPKTGRQDSADRVGLVFLGLCPPTCGKAPLFREWHLEPCGYAARLRYIMRWHSREEETTISEKHSFSAHRAAEPGV